jgi:hypothetical protein
MVKQNSQDIICPCCKKARNYERGTNLPAIETMVLQKQMLWWGKPGWILSEAKKGTLQWACNYCLKKRQALVADITQQKYCDYTPYLAYFDIEMKCENCKQEFIFSAKEQQFWYENLHFWVQSRPKQCLACRQKRRERKNE